MTGPTNAPGSDLRVRLGLVSPIVVAFPGAYSPWEASAGPEELRRVAQGADDLGYDHLTCSEHVAVPREVAEARGGTYWDPLATLSWLAAVTTHVRLVTQVLVVGYHHPLAVAKRYGTLDRLSGGRVVLGLGVGSLREEFELLGATFDGRGELADDRLRALRAALSASVPNYHGTHHDFEGFVVEPHAVQAHVPFWIGGRSRRSLRRAIDLGDGWMPFALSPAELTAMLGEHDLPERFEVVLGPARPLDPQASPDRAVEAVERMRDVGATLVEVRLQADSIDHYLEQMQAMRELVDSQG